MDRPRYGELLSLIKSCVSFIHLTLLIGRRIKLKLVSRKNLLYLYKICMEMEDLGLIVEYYYGILGSENIQTYIGAISVSCSGIQSG